MGFSCSALLVRGGSLLRNADGSLLTHALQTVAQNPPVQSKLEGGLQDPSFENSWLLGLA